VENRCGYRNAMVIRLYQMVLIVKHITAKAEQYRAVGGETPIGL
jgi:hypothetical protein